MSDELRYYQTPKPGDIVWCWFPETLKSSPAPKPRPALVVRVGMIDGKPAVAVAYGTSQRVDSLFPGEFLIEPGDGEAFRVSRLVSPTKFNLGRIVELPYNSNWFRVAPGAPFGQTPQLGILHPSLMARAQQAYAEVSR